MYVCVCIHVSYIVINDYSNLIHLTDLFIPHNVPYLDSPPNPLQFYREYVAQNKPVIIKSKI